MKTKSFDLQLKVVLQRMVLGCSNWQCHNPGGGCYPVNRTSGTTTNKKLLLRTTLNCAIRLQVQRLKDTAPQLIFTNLERHGIHIVEQPIDLTEKRIYDL